MAETALPQRGFACQVCGSAITGRRASFYCSRKCGRVVENQRRTALRRTAGVKVMIGQPFPCTTCGTEVIAKSPKSRYCDHCRKIARAETHLQQRRAKHEHYKALYKANNARRKDEPAYRSMVREASRIWTAETRKTPRGRLDHRMGQLVRNGLGGAKAGRKWESLVGYSISELCAHLERQFLPGMSWDNIGSWHVDHILPRAMISYESDQDDDFRACWALTNLRPLWAGENHAKVAKRLFLI